jgi:hypothetical protein
MTKAEQINKYLDHGLCVVVREDSDYRSFIPVKDEDGDYRRSHWVDSIEEAKQYAGDCCGYTPEQLQKEAENWEIVEVYHLQAKPYEVGQKVRILDTIKNTDDWDIIKDDSPDRKGEVIMVYNNRSGLYYSVEGEGTRSIGHKYLAPDFEEEEIKEMTVADVEKLVGKKVKIIK